MLTTHQIQEHFESLEMERLRAEVKELQSRLTRLQLELMQTRRGGSVKNELPVHQASEE